MSISMDNENRTQIILDLILPAVQLHKTTNWRPFVLGLTGLQGSGKSYLASSLAKTLNEKYDLNTIEVSLDDFYLPHDKQLELRKNNPSYDLLQNRGQPSTHDTFLASAFFDQFSQEQLLEDIWIPSFDKSRFDGDGDRIPKSEWRHLKRDKAIDVLIFEGWCVGFRPLPVSAVREKWEEAKHVQDTFDEGERSAVEFSINTLKKHTLEELLFINSALENYVDSFMGPQHFDFLVHLDTLDLVNVYTWRTQQEHALRKSRGTGMTDEQVVMFVQRYMPGYELYLGRLREGFFKGNDAPQKARAHLRVILDINRAITVTKLVDTAAEEDVTLEVASRCILRNFIPK